MCAGVLQCWVVQGFLELVSIACAVVLCHGAADSGEGLQQHMVAKADLRMSSRLWSVALVMWLDFRRTFTSSHASMCL